MLTTSIAIIGARYALEALLASRVPPASIKETISWSPCQDTVHSHLQAEVVTQYAKVLQLKVNANGCLIVRLELVVAEAVAVANPNKIQSEFSLEDHPNDSPIHNGRFAHGAVAHKDDLAGTQLRLARQLQLIAQLGRKILVPAVGRLGQAVGGRQMPQMCARIVLGRRWRRGQ